LRELEVRLDRARAELARAEGDDRARGVVSSPQGSVDPAARSLLRVGGDVRAPRKISGASPEYPPIARAAGVGGVVILEVTIGPEGRVEDARVLRSIPLLDAAAMDAVRRWTFEPTLLNGTPVSALMTVSMGFTPSNEPRAN